MRLVYLSSSTLPSRSANGFQVMKMCEAFAEQGLDVTLLAPRRGEGARAVEPAALFEHYGVRGGFALRHLPAPGPGLAGYAVAAASAARAARPALLYGRHPASLALAAHGGRPTGLELHDLPAGRLAPRAVRHLVARPNLRALVVIGRALGERLAATLGGALAARAPHVAPDGVDPRPFEELPAPAPARRALGLAPERLTVGYAGHLYAGRGIEDIVAAAAELPEIAFRVVGGSDEDLARWRAAPATRAAPNLSFVGFVPNALLPAQLAACDVLLMPYGERVRVAGGAGDTGAWMSPLKMFEYMASGRAIVSTDLPALRDVLTDRSALFVPPGDARALAAAIARLADDAQLRRALGERARADVAAYTWGARARGILDLLLAEERAA